jgi:hypothetical protein
MALPKFCRTVSEDAEVLPKFINGYGIETYYELP